MPLEGHYQRVNTPLRKLNARERNAIFAGLGVIVVALLGIVLFTAGDSRPAVAEGCIYTVVAGRTGGEPVTGCGGEAEAICAQAAQFEGPRPDKIVAECEAQGVPTSGEPGGPFSAKRAR